MPARSSESIWTAAFALLCLAQIFGYAQHFTLLPTLPLYITHLGGTPFTVGLVLASFAVTSVVVRPLMGHWADRRGEARVIVGGNLLQTASVLLCLVPFVAVTMLANGLRGIGWAGLNAGGYSLLARAAPRSRRAEASGYYSGVQNSAAVLFPAAALWLLDAPFGGFRAVFIGAAALAAVSAGCGALLRRHVGSGKPETQADEIEPGPRALLGLVERDVLLPSALHFCLQLTMPAINSFIVLYAREIGLGSIGFFYVVSGTASMLSRPLLGRLSDRIGRSTALFSAFILQILAFLLVVSASSLAGLLISGILYILGVAIGSSTTLAFAMERANPRHRGRSMASFSIAYPLSYGAGGFIAGAAVETLGYARMYLLMAGFALAGLGVAIANWRSLK
ncbi:MAG TPA: MFS transporter [candidate division Zixibacteria bacterium]|nr:MFS transporter [candidate division Zixibacteria bacterium]